jgi:hypothetical protein
LSLESAGSSRENRVAEDTPGNDEDVAGRKGRRKPLTIDLPADQVGRKAAGDEAPAEAAAPADAQAQEVDASAAAESVAPDMAAEAKPEADSSGIFVSLLVAAILGGVIVGLVVVLLARGGYFLPPPSTEVADLSASVTTLKSDVAGLRSAVGGLQQARPDPKIAALQESVTGLQKSVDALENAPAAAETAPADTSALDALKAEVASLSNDVAALKTTAPAESSAVANDVAALGQKVDALSARLDNVPDEARVAALEAAVKQLPDAARIAAIESRLDALTAKIDDAAALAPAVAADALSAAVESGRPYGAELAALRTLDVDPAKLDALAAHAASGLPTLAALNAAFEEAAASIDLSPQIAEGTGIFQRLVQSAEGLVTVKPAHPTAGADTASILARIRGALARADLKAALNEWATLPDAAKSATAAWQKDAAARQNADDLVADLRAAALARLGPKE